MNDDHLVIMLKKPIQIGDEAHSKITVFEPTGLAMKGLSSLALQGGLFDHIVKLVPKITEPRITEAMLKKMPAVDVNKFTAAVNHFLYDATMDAALDKEETDETANRVTA